MKIYTKTGDQGTTSLLGGTRVDKHHIRVECNGAVDELNAWLGLIRDQDIQTKYRDALIHIQNRLFTLGAMLASESGGKKTKRTPDIPQLVPADITFLEQEIDEMNETLPPITHFVLPGGHPAVSYCHIGRTVCRRAERITSRLHKEEPLHPQTLIFLNRLSDYLFVLSRAVSHDLKANEIKWFPGDKT